MLSTVDHADDTAPTRQHEVDHTDHTDHADHADHTGSRIDLPVDRSIIHDDVGIDFLPEV